MQAVEVEAVAAWRDGDLIWEDTPINDILADLNRYSDRQVSLANDELGGLEFTFAFRATDTELAIDVIADTLGLQMVEMNEGAIELR